MKTKRVYILLYAILAILSMEGKESYYYYRGERIPLELSDDSVRIYTNDAYSVKNISKIADDKSISSIAYIVKGDSGKTIKMSNKFYVQLRNANTDLPLLQDIAKKTNTTILGQVPYMPDWYKLGIHNSTINNSLEMSNFFYETGLVSNVDPGFVFQFTPRTICVWDSNFAVQWGMDAINACDVWNITTGNSNIKIAIIDRGIEETHPEFSSTQFIDRYDCDSKTGINHIYEDHGTWVGGVIASDHNHERIAGIAPNCKIMPISFSSNNHDSVAENLAIGFAWAVSHGADVINCSWGDHNTYTWLHSELLESAIYNALTNGRNGKGCVVVFAAGNQNALQLDYPGRIYPEILTVGAMKSNMARKEDSSWGFDLDLMAPGDYIYTTTTLLNGGYGFGGQTSIAAPHVSAIAGLMLSVNPYLTRQEVTDIIESTAQKVQPTDVNYNYYNYDTEEGRPNGKWDIEMGYGLVDAYAAVLKAKNTQIRGPERMCDTAQYYLMRPSLSGETAQWDVYNGAAFNPFYSIVGPDDQDTVVVACSYVNLWKGDAETIEDDELPTSREIGPIFDKSKYLSVTITPTSGNDSETYTKNLKHYSSATKPVISASDTSYLWQGLTQRTFTVSNCPLVPDSLFQWTVQTTTITHTPHSQPQVVTNYSNGRSITHRPLRPISPLSEVNVKISVTNTSGYCAAVSSDTLQFSVVRQLSLLTGAHEGTILNITIANWDETEQYVPIQLEKNNTYTLELWHNIYGLVRALPTQTPNEQISISGLPQGVYVLLLKENDVIIAETKVQIQ